MLFSESIELLKEGGKSLVREKLKKAMKMKPLYIKIWVLYIISGLPGQSSLRVLNIAEVIMKTISRIKLNFYKLYY